MNDFFIIIIFSFLISFIVLLAIIFLYFKKETLENLSLPLISLSAGFLLGGAFLHLLPEASEKIKPDEMYLIVLFAFVFFFFMEKLLNWRHCHETHCEIHSFGYMSLFGDSLHNFIDGLIIASTFIIDFNLGLFTTLIIAMHEIPQEIGDFGVLIHAGFKRKQALIINYLVSLTVVLGGITGYFLFNYISDITKYLLPFAAGGFIYIATSDLIPLINKETNQKKSIITFVIFITSIILTYFIKEFI